MAIVEAVLSFLLSTITSSKYTLLLSILSAILVPVIVIWLRSRSKRGPNPFASDTRRPAAPVIHDQAERDKVLKQGFAAKKVPQDLDAIVIGSGIGGLSCAALLSRAGKKALVLEQHDQAGGCCHTFHEKGFEFDTGIHCIGEMQCNSASKFLIDQITDGQLLWAPLEKNYDTVMLGYPDNLRSFPMVAGKKEFKEAMLEKFPDEAKAINKYLEMLADVRRGIPAMVGLKIMPKWLASFLVKTGIINLMTNYFKYSQRTLTEVLEELTDNQDLRAVLGYCFGDYGTPPYEASFAMHALLINHFLYGSSYPRGGASEIAMQIIPTIEKSGGKVLVRAQVTKILVDEQTKKATGVRVHKSSGDIDIFAPVVVSAAGMYNTYESLLPKEVSPLPALMSQTRGIRHGWGGLMVFVGLKGSKEELGLKATNTWVFTGNDLDQAFKDFVNTESDEAGYKDIPLLFISFPSTKDPEWEKRHEDKSTCEIVSLAPYKWFEEWEKNRVMKRGDDYEELKHRIGRRMWEQACTLFPQLRDKEEYFDIGSPVTNNYYLGTPRGEIYGIDHNKDRFCAETVMALRPETPISGLYLTGQDVLNGGFGGAMFGGLFSASAILGRNVFSDMMELRAKVKKTGKKHKVESNREVNVANGSVN